MDEPNELRMLKPPAGWQVEQSGIPDAQAAVVGQTSQMTLGAVGRAMAWLQ